MMGTGLRLVAWVCCVVIWPPLTWAASKQADLVLYNGKIITVDNTFSIKSAIAVREDKILAVGGPEIAARYSAPRRIDLHGRSVLPGFMDTHLHIFGVSHREVDLRNATSIEEVKSLVGAKARQLGPGEWVVGNYWDEGNLIEHRRPFRADLDAVAPGNPVVLIRAGGHSAVGNSLALKAAGITRNTTDTQRYVFEHDVNGEPNGFVRESLTLFMPLVPPDSPSRCGPVMLRKSARCSLWELPARSSRVPISRPSRIRYSRCRVGRNGRASTRSWAASCRVWPSKSSTREQMPSGATLNIQAMATIG
jgi:predicted amidohydrolase YtcJ